MCRAKMDPRGARVDEWVAFASIKSQECSGRRIHCPRQGTVQRGCNTGNADRIGASASGALTTLSGQIIENPLPSPTKGLVPHATLVDNPKTLHACMEWVTGTDSRGVCVCLLLLCAQESIQNRYKINFHFNPSQMVIFVQLQMMDHVQLLIYSVGLAVTHRGRIYISR